MFNSKDSNGDTKQPLYLEIVQQDIKSQKSKSSSNNQEQSNQKKNNNAQYFNEIINIKVEQFKNQLSIKTLFMIGVIGFSFQFYNCNMQGFLKKSIMDVTKIDEVQYQLFLTLQGVLGVPFAFVGGVMLDKLGYVKGYIIYNFIIVVGAWVMSIGGYYNSFIGLLIGVTINSIGLQLAVGAENSFVYIWFIKHEDQITASGYYQTSLKLSILFSGILYPLFFDKYNNLFMPIMFGAIFSVIFFILSLNIPYMYKKSQKIKSELQQDYNIQEEQNSQYRATVVTLKDLKEFDKEFWLLILNFAINSFITTIFSSNINTLFQNKFQTTQQQNGIYVSIQNFIGIISPVLSFLMNKWYLHDGFLIFGSVCSVIQQLYILLIPSCDEECFYTGLPSTIFMGLFTAIFYIILIPQVGALSPNHLIGTAYGIFWGTSQFVQAVVPLITVGPLLKNVDVLYTFIFFLILSILGLFLTIYRIKRRRQNQENRQQQNHKNIIVEEQNIKYGKSNSMELQQSLLEKQFQSQQEIQN